MGNKFACSTDTNHPQNSNLVRKIRSKINSNSVHSDSFIIEHCQMNKANDKQISIESLETRRVVFISTMGLYHTWRHCPSVVLYAALFALPLKRKWIYHPQQYHDDIATFADIDPAETKQFLSLLRWKDSQGLMCWMLDENVSTDDVHSVWRQMNDKLQSLFDPITSAKYNKIELNSAFWNSTNYVSKYDVESDDILAEICCPSLKFSVIQEMIHQSNPLSLVPLSSYSQGNDNKFVSTVIEDDDDNNDGWWISSDYDPHDIHYDVM